MLQTKLLNCLLLCIVLLGSCIKRNANSKDFNHTAVKPYNVKGLDTVKTQSGLKYILVHKNPSGKQPLSGKKVAVNYTGFFSDGKIFDSSVLRGEPLTFTIGIGKVIKGWDEGIALMHEGEKARFIIPCELGYGVEGSGPIPPLSTLVFDVELLAASQQ